MASKFRREKGNGAKKGDKEGKSAAITREHVRSLDASVEESEEELANEVDRINRNGGIL